MFHQQVYECCQYIKASGHTIFHLPSHQDDAIASAEELELLDKTISAVQSTM